MQHAFTTKYSGRVNVLKTKVGICLPFLGEPKQKEKIKTEEFVGIWDTGATGSVITTKVVNKLNLKPIRVTKVHHAGGQSIAKVHLVNISLPNNVMVMNVKVTEGVLPEDDDAEVLIGMDIIGMGDFSVTNFDNKTTISFCMPSYKEIDYVHEANKVNLSNMNRRERRRLEALKRKGKI